MTPMTLVEQEEHLSQVLKSRRFLEMDGISNEVPFFIYPYEVTDALEIAKAKQRIMNRLGTQGIVVHELNLYDLCVDVIKGEGDWEEVLEIESMQDKKKFAVTLQSMLDPERDLAPAIEKKLAGEAFNILFLTGIGHVFPYIRSHTLLTNLHSVIKDKPVLIYFPGTYEQSDTMGSSLALFGRMNNDQYYRAKNIIDQEP